MVGIVIVLAALVGACIAVVVMQYMQGRQLRVDHENLYARVELWERRTSARFDDVDKQLDTQGTSLAECREALNLYDRPG